MTFVEIEGNRGQLRYGLHPQPTAAGYASPASYRVSTQAGLVINLEEMAEGGDVWLNSNVSYDTPALKAGGKGFQTLLHETLHSLGLKHPFEGTQLLEPVDDHWLTTVMSYTPPEENKRIQVSGDPVTGWSWTLEELSMGTPMLGDIAALQALYGPNRSTGAGNSTYRWELDAIRRETLWDGSGKDTIDASNQTEPCRIDLREGSLSSIGVRTDPAAIAALHRVPANFPLEHLPTGLYTGTNNLSIAFGCLIEQANGGLADDVLIGNALGNNLSGGHGLRLRAHQFRRWRCFRGDHPRHQRSVGTARGSPGPGGCPHRLHPRSNQAAEVGKASSKRFQASLCPSPQCSAAGDALPTAHAEACRRPRPVLTPAGSPGPAVKSLESHRWRCPRARKVPPPRPCPVENQASDRRSAGKHCLSLPA